jgi:poly(3-hydroxyalkanoate) synthetase
MAGHSIRASHHLSFKNTTVLLTMVGHIHYLVDVSNPSNFNRNTWTNLSQTWKAVSEILDTNSIFCMADCLHWLHGIQPLCSLQILKI